MLKAAREFKAGASSQSNNNFNKARKMGINKGIINEHCTPYCIELNEFLNAREN